jgi:hypothetical protein
VQTALNVAGGAKATLTTGNITMMSGDIPQLTTIGCSKKSAWKVFSLD